VLEKSSISTVPMLETVDADTEVNNKSKSLRACGFRILRTAYPANEIAVK
jgi:hypothetical protein